MLPCSQREAVVLGSVSLKDRGMEEARLGATGKFSFKFNQNFSRISPSQQHSQNVAFVLLGTCIHSPKFTNYLTTFRLDLGKIG